MPKSDASGKSTKKPAVKGGDVDMDSWDVVQERASDPELKLRPHSAKHLKSLEKALRQERKKPFPEIERGPLGFTRSDMQEARKTLDRTIVSVGEATKSAAQFTSMALGDLYSSAGSYVKRLRDSGNEGVKKSPALAAAPDKALKRRTSSMSNSSNSSRRSSGSGGHYIG